MVPSIVIAAYRPRILLVTPNLQPWVGGTERLDWLAAGELVKAAAVIIFLIGLVSGQITSLTYRRDN